MSNPWFMTTETREVLKPRRKVGQVECRQCPKDYIEVHWEHQDTVEVVSNVDGVDWGIILDAEGIDDLIERLTELREAMDE
jgi:hypothetical protein